MVQQTIIPICSTVLGIPLLLLSFVFFQDFRNDGKKISVLLMFLAVEKLLSILLLPNIQADKFYYGLDFGISFLSFSYAVGMLIMDGKSIVKISNYRKRRRQK